MKKLCFFSLFFFIACCFSFAQSIKVIGVIPKNDTGKTYQLQIGAFRNDANISSTALTLTKNGFTPLFQKHDNLTRVFVTAAACDVRTAINRLGCAGFREVIIREYVVTAERQSAVTPEIEYTITPKEEVTELPKEFVDIPEETVEIEIKFPLPNVELEPLRHILEYL